MKTFNNLRSFSDHLKKVCASHAKYETLAAEFIGKELKKEARDAIGHLHDAAGPFKKWAELAESTKQDKERLGYVFNADYNPLLRTGELRDSIDYSVIPGVLGTLLLLGSSSQIMIYQELGTAYIPPRSVLGATMFKSYPTVSYTLTAMLAAWLESKSFSKPRSKTYGSV